MSLLINSELIEIDMYYKYVEKEGGKRMVIISNKKAKELLEDEEKAKNIEVLKTKWRIPTWKEQNEIMEVSSKVANPTTGEKQFNFLAYRDAMVKRCLKEWDIKENDAVVAVSDAVIDQLPGTVVVDLYRKFEQIIDYGEEELGN
jgi:hypothetical protein